MSREFTAAYSGRCLQCHGEIEVGDLVRFNDDDELVHAEHRPKPPAKAETICDKCWLVKPCDCED